MKKILIFIFIVAVQAQNTNEVELLRKNFRLYQKYTTEGNYNKAFVYAKRTFTISKDLYGNSHLYTLRAMSHLGTIYREKGLYNKSEDILNQALDLYQKSVGKAHNDTLNAMSNLAMVYQIQKKYVQAERICEEVVRISKTILNNSYNTLIYMDNLTTLYIDQQKYTEAKPLCLQVLKLCKKILPNAHPDTLKVMNDLGKLHEALGEYNQAQSLFNKTLSLRKKILGEEDPETLTSIHNLAMVLFYQGEYNKALNLCLDGFGKRKKVLGKQHRDTLTSMNDLSIIYSQLGEFDKAQSVCERTWLLRKKLFGENHPSSLTTMLNLATIYEDQGRYEKAKNLYLEELRLSAKNLGKNHPDTLTSMNNVALFYTKQNEYVKAESFFRETLQAQQFVLGLDHPNTLSTMNNLALLYLKQQKYKEADVLCKKVFLLCKKKLGETHPDTLTYMGNLAALHLERGEYKKAKTLCAKNLYLLKKVLGDHLHTLDAMNNLSVAYCYSYNYTQSLTVLNEWFSKRNKYLYRLLPVLSKKRQKYFLDEDKKKIKLLLSLYLNDENANKAHNILNYSLQRKGILLRFSPDTLTKLARKIPGIAKQIATLQDKRFNLATLTLTPPNNVSFQQLQKNIRSLQDEIEDLEAELAKNSYEFKRFKQNQDLTPLLLQEKLDNEEVVVDFLAVDTLNLQNKKFTDNPTFLLATIVNKKQIKVINLGKYSQVKQLIASYRLQIHRLGSKNNELARKIYDIVWAPINQYCKESTTIYVIPDGDLHLFPMTALVDNEGQYLLKKYDMQIISTAHHLIYATEDYDFPKSKSILFVNPDYGNATAKANGLFSGIYFSNLPGTKKEGQILAKMLVEKKEHVKLFSKLRADKKNLLETRSPKILHIATHGFFLNAPQAQTSKQNRAIVFRKKEANLSTYFEQKTSQNLINPLIYSGLALTNANADTAKGILTAMEVLSLDLSGTELVTLSACSTSVGEVVSGEGVYSLRRAFQEAGTKAILSSLWPANDEGTLYLMHKFYKHYLDGVAPQSALRNAQIECISEKKYAHAYYWANFVMTGVDRHFTQHHRKIPLQTNFSQKSYYLWILWSVIFVIVVLIIIRVQRFNYRKRSIRHEIRMRKYHQNK